MADISNAIKKDYSKNKKNKPKKEVEEKPKEIIGWNPDTFNPVFKDEVETKKNTEFLSPNEWRYVYGGSGSVFPMSSSLMPPITHSIPNSQVATPEMFRQEQMKYDALRADVIAQQRLTILEPSEPSITFELNIKTSAQLMKGVTAFMEGNTTFHKWLETI